LHCAVATSEACFKAFDKSFIIAIFHLGYFENYELFFEKLAIYSNFIATKILLLI